jgi:peptidoglycan/xylan/chitin deacetylase (PgdA/CDA1 family)
VARSLLFRRGMTPPPNLVTVDVDDRLATAPTGVDPVIDGLLAALAESGTRATFFVTRRAAAAGSGSIRRLAQDGHDVACLTTMAPAGRTPYCAEFRSELGAARQAIENATGVRVRGHRAVGFGVDFASEWAYDVLVDEGFDYDSSRFPSRHTEYGYLPVPQAVHAVKRWGGILLEVPETTVDLLAVRVAIATTGAVRTLPTTMWRYFVESRQARAEPVVLHLNAVELAGADRRQVFRGGIDRGRQGDRRTLERISKLVQSFSFTSVSSALPELLRSAPIIES